MATDEGQQEQVLDLGAPGVGEEALDLDNTVSSLVSKTYLVWKIVSSRYISPAKVKAQTSAILACNGTYRVIEKGKNLFLFGFEFEHDRNKILRKAPWSVSGQLLVVKCWPPNLAIEQVDFSTTVFKVQIHGLPPDLSSLWRIEKLGGLFAEYNGLEETIKNMYGWLGFIRMKVQVRIDSPLISGILVKDFVGNTVWVSFKYEKLADFCYRCGRLDHTLQACKESPRPDEGIEKRGQEALALG
ncbi:hypothetical protein Tsubulata_047363 [Turnera subulata]|uniref:CCHC-type domain-containing protein n=1 Tax=Turnera subulata TaxID=218843 RepID=A0A9Q0JB08_9ROSI|nr:hypothetical protein Tsubulata_047363 [Turnera subulata]